MDPLSVKITRPRAGGLVSRERLFRLLDGEMEKPVIWVSAPAGSGKTALVSSYLDERGLPCIWYQCDEGDANPATFFYYMGLAARKAVPTCRDPLPLLTSEYLEGIPAFTRRYFEILYSRLASRYGSRKPGSSSRSKRGGAPNVAIVLDNVQEVPDDSMFHEMAAHGLDVIPEAVIVLVLSRGDPPSPLARLRAGGKIGRVASGELRFSVEESKALVRARMPDLKTSRIQEMHEKSEGWAAGIILMLERMRIQGPGSGSTGSVAYEGVFDYFAGEIFNRSDPDVQDILLKTAFFPVIRVPFVEKMTGVSDAGPVFETLVRRNYFTERLSGDGEDYRYHPLFRDFLLNRARIRFPPDALAAIQQEAALLLEQSGEIEAGADLYCRAGDWDGLARMVTRHARELSRQGRGETVKAWIEVIPAQWMETAPWLSYWAGMCSFPLDMRGARKHLEKALDAFRATGDASGSYLAWAGIVDTYAFDLDEWKHLDRCIQVFEDLRKAHPSFPSKTIDLMVSSRMLIALTLRKTDRTQWIHEWLERVSGLLQQHPSFDIQMDTLFCMDLYYLWKGAYHKNAVLLERAEAAIRYHRPPPFAVIRVKLMKGIHSWVTAAYEAALKGLSEGLEISRDSGVHVFDSLLWSFRAAAEMASGRMEAAETSLEHQMTCLLGAERTLDRYFYHINAAWYALLEDRPALAAEHMETIAPMVQRMGTPYYRALWEIGMAQVAFLQGRSADAKTHVHKARRISLRIKSQVLEWYSLLHDAYFRLTTGEEGEGEEVLHRALSLGRMHDFVHLEFYQPKFMRILCATALQRGIEREYARGLVRTLGLTPPHPADPGPPGFSLEDWPYPIRIYTLGRFEILREDEPLAFSGKVQKKPLDMLKALIASGGRNVPAERLTDALWPEAEGDLAHKSLETTLRRLRHLLGDNRFVTYQGGQLGLDPLYCWVDSLALQALFDEVKRVPEDRVAALCEASAGLYGGPFLPSDRHLEWTVSMREMLKDRLLGTLVAAGRAYERTDRWEQAAAIYRNGLEADFLVEAFYQRLMVCHGKLGHPADVVRTYRRCCTVLQAELGVGPSAETEDVYASILSRH